MNAVWAAAHVHSNWSYDGEWSLEAIARVFRRLGYDVVLMAEHDRGFTAQRWEDYREACAAVSRVADVLLVPGLEYADTDNVVHTVVWSPTVPFLGAGEDTLHILRAAQEYNAACVFAHPWRRNALTRYEPEWSDLLTAVEVWNRKYDGVAPNRQGRDFAESVGLPWLASLDFHSGRQLFPLGISLSLAGPTSSAALVEAMRRHAFVPKLMGLPVDVVSRGVGGASLRRLEGLRRTLRGPARRLRGELAREPRAARQW
jgi:predicted metal-dependent phosphoesterase TrpH